MVWVALDRARPCAPEDEAHEVKVNYADYGVATAVQQPPAGDAVEAPDNIHKLFKD